METVESGHETNPVDALRLNSAQRTDLLWELQAASAEFMGNDKRDGKRIAFDQPDGVVLRVSHPGGSIIHYLTQPRNLSPGGITLLHGGFLYPQSDCTVRLNTVDGEPFTISGRIVHCRQVSGRCHEVGIAFYSPIDIADFIPGLEDGRETVETMLDNAAPDSSNQNTSADTSGDEFNDLDFKFE